MAYVGRETLDGRTLDHLAVTPRGGLRFDAGFDAGSHLLDRIAEDQMFLHTRTLFADYRPEGGEMLPHRITIDGGEGEASCEALSLTRAIVSPARPGPTCRCRSGGAARPGSSRSSCGTRSDPGGLGGRRGQRSPRPASTTSRPAANS